MKRRQHDLFVLGAVGIAVLLVGLIVLLADWTRLPPIGWPVLLAAAALYLATHLLRGLRLFLLLYEGRVRIRPVVSIHLLAAAVSWIIPFKLGELYRLALIARGIASWPRAIMVVWLERVFDALAVAGIILAIDSQRRWSWLVVLLIAFLGVSFFAYLVLPEWLALWKRYLITRHNDRRSLRILARIDRLHELLRGYKAMFCERWASLIWLSALIWALEAGLLLLVLHALFATVDQPTFATWFHQTNTQAILWSGGLGETGLALRLVTCDALVVVVFLGTGWWLTRRLRGARRKEP